MEEEKRSAVERPEEGAVERPEEGAVENAEEGAVENAEGLSREEILSRAKKENANGDERQRSQMQWANYAGFIAMELACVIIMFSKIFTGNEFTPEFFCIMFTGVAAQNIVQACVNKNKKTKAVFIVCAALITAGAVIMWIFWILGLCGIEI